MKKVLSIILAVALMAVMAVPAFAANDVLLIAPAPDTKKIEAQKLADDYDWKALEGQGITLNVFNWGEYMSLESGEDEVHLNHEFEEWYYETYGERIEVVYSVFSSNEEMYAKLRNGSSKIDLIIPKPVAPTLELGSHAGGNR